MADPIIELIAQEVESRVSNVTTANEFNQTLDVVRPVRLGVDSLKDNLAAIIQQDPVPNDEHSVDGNPYCQAWDIEFVVALFSRPSEKDTNPAQKYLNRMWADVIQAVTRFGEVDAATWHTFGSRAIDAVISAPAYGVADDGTTSVVAFGVTVTYRTNENDPYTAR